VLGDVAGRVRLNEQIDIALVFIRGYGRVRADNFLGLAGNGGGQGNVLADREAEDIGRTRKFEAVAR